jgi:site-specific recombinase XerC
MVWNKGQIVGQKKALRLEEIWRIRTRLELEDRDKELTIFNLALDSKLRSCDLLKLKVRNVASGMRILPRVMILQQKTRHEVHFELSPRTQQTLYHWIFKRKLKPQDYLFSSNRNQGDHISYTQYERMVKRWASDLGLDRTQYSTHSLRRTKASIIYAKTKNLRAIQLLLGHTKLESTIQYLGVELEDALRLSEQIET